MTDQAKLYAAARKALLRGDLRQGRLLFKVAGEFGKVKWGPTIEHA